MTNFNLNRGVVEKLIIVNVIMFIPWVLSFVTANQNILNLFYNYLGLNLFRGAATVEKGAVWQLLSSMFMHGGIWHIILNMYGLYAFGKPVERIFGDKKFISFYLITGILANVATVIVYYILGVPYNGVGASGAIFAILVAYTAYYPDSTILVFFVVPMKIKWGLVLIVVLSIFWAITGTVSGIGHVTHLFGALFGFIYMLILMKRNPFSGMFLR